MECVIGAQDLAQPTASVVGLLPSFLGKLDPVVGNRLVDFAVLYGLQVSHI